MVLGAAVPILSGYYNHSFRGFIAQLMEVFGFSMAMLNNQMVYHGFLWPGISSSLFGFLALEWSSGYFL